MIRGISLYWATWLPDGTGIVAQSGFSGSPFGIFRLAFPRGLHNCRTRKKPFGNPKKKVS